MKIGTSGQRLKTIQKSNLDCHFLIDNLTGRTHGSSPGLFISGMICANLKSYF